MPPPKSNEAIQALALRAGIVVNATRSDRRRLDAIGSDRRAPQKHLWARHHHPRGGRRLPHRQTIRPSGKSMPVAWRAPAAASPSALCLFLDILKSSIMVKAMSTRTTFQGAATISATIPLAVYPRTSEKCKAVLGVHQRLGAVDNWQKTHV